MKAFVTGGTGFIGSHLVDALIANNQFEEVRCLVRADEKWLRHKLYIKIQGSLHNMASLKKAMSDIDVVFHLAGVVKASKQKTFRQVNVEGAENIIRIAQKQNVPKVVILSSLAAVGPSNGVPVDEHTAMKPVSMYGRSKKMMEEIVHQLSNDQTSATILRPAAVYGPREEQILAFFKMTDKHFCPIVGDGYRPKVSMIYVGDVIQACLKAAKQRKPGVETYCLANEEIYTWNQIRRITQRVLGKKAIPIYIKSQYVKKIASGIEKAASFFGHYPVINREKARELILEWTCSIEKAKKELNFAPSYSLEEGISRTIHWYKKHHWL
jgi:nucleoside-diphosphate-sugar epimerase